MMYSFAILFTVASVAASGHPGQKAAEPPSKYMPNIEYFLRGYNVLKGNPHQTSVSAVDPGFQEPIFKLSYDQGSVTPDDKYFSPDGTIVTKCQSCSLGAVTKKISGMNAYRDSLSEKVKFAGAGECLGCPQCPLCPCPGCPWWCHYAFFGSVDYKKVETEIYQHSNFYTHSDASCCAYQVQTNLYKPPPFSSDFLRGIISLPCNCTSTEDKALYRKFIDSFGTNYIKQADMGSLFGQEIKISEQSWKSMINESIDIDWSLRWSFNFAWGYIDAKYDDEREKIKEFHKFTSSRELYTKGSKPPKDGKLSTWIEEAKKSPAPIALELGSMLDLFTSLKVNKPTIKCMNESLYNYCDNKTCKEILKDKCFPGDWQRWLTNFTTGQRSDPMYCGCGEYVSRIRLSRDSWWLWPDGLFDFCFTCSSKPDEWKCFNATDPPIGTYWGMVMMCPIDGFKRMRTYEATYYDNHPINVQSECDTRYPITQNAFHVIFQEKWDHWVECGPGKKISGFQVMRNWWAYDPTYKYRIMNFRFLCR